MDRGWLDCQECWPQEGRENAEGASRALAIGLNGAHGTPGGACEAGGYGHAERIESDPAICDGAEEGTHGKGDQAKLDALVQRDQSLRSPSCTQVILRQPRAVER